MVLQKTLEDGASAYESPAIWSFNGVFDSTNQICQEINQIKQEVWKEVCLEAIKTARTQENLDPQEVALKAMEFGREAKTQLVEKLRHIISNLSNFKQPILSWVEREGEDFINLSRQKMLQDILMKKLNLDELADEISVSNPE